MNATELYQKAQLQEAIDAQVQAVKSKPADQSVRLFLFELLSFSGDLDRAQKQLDVIKYEDMDLQTALMKYRLLLESERVRRKVFHEGATPKFPDETPPEHVKLRLEALQQFRAGDPRTAKQTYERADAAAPPAKGTLNGKPFDVLRDLDDRFGQILEVMVHGNYFWVPFEHIDQVMMNPPKFPRDLLWAPARLQTHQGTIGDVYIPILYPDSHTHADSKIKLGRETVWSNPDAGPVFGTGAGDFLCGDDPMLLLDWRQLTFDEPPQAQTDEAKPDA